MSLILRISRFWKTPKAITGIAYLHKKGDNSGFIYSCFSLENPIIGIESGKDLAIPAGTYKTHWYDSPRFKKRLICLSNDLVPSNRRILIHTGNRQEDTQGCILLGCKINSNFCYIYDSGLAVSELHKALGDDLPTIIIENCFNDKMLRVK